MFTQPSAKPITGGREIRNEGFAKKSATVKIVATKMVTCGVFNGCRCTICGGFFGDGDDICASGHWIGQQYVAA